MEEARRQPTEQDLLWLIDEGRNWVVRQRAKYRPIAVPLSDPLKARLASFFAPTTPDAPAILGVTRYCSVPVIENPPFRAEAIDRGLIESGAMDFTKMAGLTFQDTFLISRAGSLSNSGRRSGG
jgi:hypothetical protein